MKQAMAIIGTLLAIFCGVLPASANTLTVTPNSDGSVTMVADEGVDGVARINLTFSYSTVYLEPRLIFQGGDYSQEQMARDSKPGTLKLDIDRSEMLEAGFIMIADFDMKPENKPCSINFVVATYTYADGRAAAPRVIILPPVEPPIKEDTTFNKKDESQPPKANAAAVKAAPPSPERAAGAVGGKGGGASAAEAAGARVESASGDAAQPLEYYSCPDILQRFRDYRGDRSLASLIALFNYENPCAYEQTPAVAISDGLNKVIITLETDPALRNAPNLGLSGARLVSMRRGSDQTWSIELLPNPGEHSVVLYVLTGRVLKRIPLIVAPPLALYLKGLAPGEKLSPLLEFVVAANYLATHQETAAKAGQ